MISNDSGLAYPLDQVRDIIPVGTVNPTRSYLAGALRGTLDAGPGQHWWYQLTAADLYDAQLPETIGTLHRPQGW